MIPTRRALTAVLALTSFLTLAPILRADDRPNIIFLLADDQRADTLGCYGNPVVRTPHIDSLAERGTLFRNAFVTTSICMTSRAGIFLGQYAARHQINDFATPLNDAQLRQTYLTRLKQAGYRVAFIGKWGVGQPPRDTWDYDRAWPGQNVYWHDQPDGGRKHLTAIHAEQALEFLDSATPDQPFLLSVSFKAPHVQDTASVNEDPFPEDTAFNHLYTDITFPRPASDALFDRRPDFLKDSENRARWAVRFWGPARYQDSVRGYYRLVSGIDAAVGRILARLRDKGLDSNTVVIYGSDHGFYLGEYGFAGKWFAHDVSIRIPLIIFDPRRPAPQGGSRRDEFALSIDIAPTILSLAALPPDPAMQGRDLTPLLHDGPAPSDWRQDFFYEHHFIHPRIPRSEAVRTHHHKYIRYLDSQPLFEELYDLDADPGETLNLAPDPMHLPVLRRMRSLWAERRERAR